MSGVSAADADHYLAGGGGAAADGTQQQRTAGDGLAMVVGVGEAHEQRSLIEHQRHEARHQPAPLQVLRRETAPAPLVLQLVEVVLGVATVAVQLSEREGFGTSPPLFL
jgi:hypothetical protein